VKKPTKAELQTAREQVKDLFLDSDWFEVMKHWKGACWHRDEIMCGLLVGLKIAENRAAGADKGDGAED